MKFFSQLIFYTFPRVVVLNTTKKKQDSSFQNWEVSWTPEQSTPR